MVLLSSTAAAQEGYGTVTFTIQVLGSHNVPTTDGGFRKIEKSRTFSGKARMKYVGPGFAQPTMNGYDMLKGPRTDVWANEGCSGEIQIADKGTYRGVSEVGMMQSAYSLSAKQPVNGSSGSADSCSFSLVYDPRAQTASITIDAGPSPIEAVERLDDVSRKTHLNPFDWSSVRKFEKGGIKVIANKAGHSGVWSESAGEPMALVGTARASGEKVQTSTRVSWQFMGQVPSKPAENPSKYDEVETVPGDLGEAAIAGCVKEAQAGRSEPDPVKLMECVEKKASTPRR